VVTFVLPCHPKQVPSVYSWQEAGRRCEIMGWIKVTFNPADCQRGRVFPVVIQSRIENGKDSLSESVGESVDMGHVVRIVK